jgi:hypothetical protein
MFQQHQAQQIGGSTGTVARRAWQTTPKVWTLTADALLVPIPVRLGISDDQFSELKEGALEEGQELLIGVHEKDGRGESGARSGAPARTSTPPVRL